MIDISSWKINPANTRVICFAWPDHRLHVKTFGWLLDRFPRENIVVWVRRDYIVARNTAIRDLVLKAPEQYSDFVFMDRDIAADERADAFLTVDADVVGCMHRLENPTAWSLPDVFHSGFWRARRKVLEAIAPPWFMRPYAPDGCSLPECDCGYLRRKILAAGFSIAHAGWAEHEQDGSWWSGRECWC